MAQAKFCGSKGGRGYGRIRVSSSDGCSEANPRRALYDALGRRRCRHRLLGRSAARRLTPAQDAAPYFRRSITRRTWPGSQIPRPVAVGTPRLLSALAIPYQDVIPLRRSSATIGASSDARASARAIRALRPASPDLDFPVTAMASRGKDTAFGGHGGMTILQHP
jgi:hypothetical protein